MKILKKCLSLLLSLLLLLSLFSGCGKGPKKTEGPTVGIDVARYQGTIDWDRVAAAGIDFVMVRVGYRTQEDGIIREDSNARYNLQEAQRVGIRIGAYFFSSATTEEEALEEARWVADFIAPYAITYPVAYNCEGFDDPAHRNHTLTKSERTDLAIVFLEAIREAGYEPMFYASKNEMEADIKWEVSRMEEDFLIWVAQYPAAPYPATESSDYSGVHQMWQYTREGTVDGIPRPVDRNVAYFGYDGIREPKSDVPPEPAEPDPEALMNFTEVSETVTAKIEVNLRSLPTTGEESDELYLLKNGETALRTGISDNGWSRLEFRGQRYYAVTSLLTTDLNYDPDKAAPEGVDADGDGIITEFAPADDVVTAKEATNLRTLPSTENEDSVVIYQLKHGETVQRTGISDNGWSRLVYRGQVCYAVTSLLTTEIGDGAQDVSAAVEVTMAFQEVNDRVTARIKVNLRTLPSTEDPASVVVYQLVNGDVAIRTGIALYGEWARVEYNGQVLYCINNYLEKVE